MEAQIRYCYVSFHWSTKVPIFTWKSLCTFPTLWLRFKKCIASDGNFLTKSQELWKGNQKQEVNRDLKNFWNIIINNKKKMLFQVKTVNHYFISHCIVLYITQKLHLIEIKRIELMWQQFQEWNIHPILFTPLFYCTILTFTLYITHIIPKKLFKTYH